MKNMAELAGGGYIRGVSACYKCKPCCCVYPEELWWAQIAYCRVNKDTYSELALQVIIEAADDHEGRHIRDYKEIPNGCARDDYTSPPVKTAGGTNGECGAYAHEFGTTAEAACRICGGATGVARDECFEQVKKWLSCGPVLSNCKNACDGKGLCQYWQQSALRKIEACQNQ